MEVCRSLINTPHTTASIITLYDRVSFFLKKKKVLDTPNIPKITTDDHLIL